MKNQSNKNQSNICCKLAVVPQQREYLESTFQAFADACNYLWEYGHHHQMFGQWNLHQACYRTIRKQFGLPANLAIRAIARVATDLKGARSVYPFQPDSVLFDSRTFLMHEWDWSVGITLLNGREKFHLDIGKLQKNQLNGQEALSATLFKKYKSYYLEILIQPTKKDDRKVAVPNPTMPPEAIFVSA